MSEHPLNTSSEVSDLPELDNDKKEAGFIQDQEESEQSTKKKKKLKPVLIAIVLLFLIAAGLAIFASLQIGKVMDSNSHAGAGAGGEENASKLSPLQIQNISLTEAAPKKQNEPHAQKIDKKESSNLLSGIDPNIDDSTTPVVDDVNDSKPEELSSQKNNAANEPEGLMTEIDLREKQTIARIESLEKSVQAIQSSIDGLNQNLSDYTKQAAFNERELSDIKSSVRSVNSKIKKVSYLVKKQEKKTLSRKVKNPTPPKPSSFAIWNNRNAVYVEYPKGKLTMLYKGDVINSWEVVSINSVTREVKFKRGKKTVKLSIGGRK